jgi:4,5-epoxidase
MGMIGAMPMPGDLWRIIAYDPGQGGETPSEDQILGRLEVILPERTGRDVHIVRAEWLSMFSVHRRLAETYRRDRVLIAGDAGHTHAPFGGQGMLTGLGDVENLAWKLALVVGGQACEALLDSYEAERRPLATEVLRSTSAVTKINVASGPIGRFIRDQIIVRVFKLPVVQRWVTYQTSQLLVSYRRGPLAERTCPTVKPRPGDRVPDEPCVRLDGEPTRLHVGLRGRWALLSSGAEGDRQLAQTVQVHLGARAVVLRRATGEQPDSFLVRPDGHLAWRGRQAGSLADWLRRALGEGRVR